MSALSDAVLVDLAMLRRVAALPKPTHVFVSIERANRDSTAPHTASDFQPLFGPNGNLAERQRLAGLRTEEP